MSQVIHHDKTEHGNKTPSRFRSQRVHSRLGYQDFLFTLFWRSTKNRAVRRTIDIRSLCVTFFWSGSVLFLYIKYFILCTFRLSHSQSGDEVESPLSDKCSRKTLFYLIATLNESFRPDYDFSRTRGYDFSREPSVNWVETFWHLLMLQLFSMMMSCLNYICWDQ